MVKLTTMLSVWLWGGIFVFLFLYFSHRKEIKEAELESIHLCIIFTICCFVGLPAAVIEIFGLWEDDEEENEGSDRETDEEYSRKRVEDLKEMKETIDIILSHFR